MGRDPDAAQGRGGSSRGDLDANPSAAGLPAKVAVVGLVVLAIAGAVILWAGLSARTAGSAQRISEAQARSIAVAWVGSQPNPLPYGANPFATGWSVTSDRYEANGARVIDSSGNVVASESGSLCVPVVMLCVGATPVWEVELSGPAQGQWTGVVVIDAATGKVRSASTVGHN